MSMMSNTCNMRSPYHRILCLYHHCEHVQQHNLQPEKRLHSVNIEEHNTEHVNLDHKKQKSTQHTDTLRTKRIKDAFNSIEKLDAIPTSTAYATQVTSMKANSLKASAKDLIKLSVLQSVRKNVGRPDDSNIVKKGWLNTLAACLKNSCDKHPDTVVCTNLRCNLFN